MGKFPGTAYGHEGMISHLEPVKLIPGALSLDSSNAKFVNGACARSHCLLVSDDGEVWGCGVNVTGQLGMVSAMEEDLSWADSLR